MFNRIKWLGLSIMVLPFQIQADNNPVLLKVDGKEFKKTEVLETIQGQVPEEKLKDPKFQGAYKRFLEQYARRYLFGEDAKKQVKDDDAELKKRLEAEKDSIRAELHIMRHVAAVTDAEIKKAYAQKYSKTSETTSAKQLHAIHVLFKAETDAQKFIDGLEKGGKFEDLAKEAQKAGHRFEDLGFFNHEDMVPEFSAAAFALEEGKHTTKPVKTSFGHHVILSKKKQDKPVPSLAEVQEQIKHELMRDKVEAKAAELISKAKIEKFTLEGKALTDPEKEASTFKNDAKAKAFSAPISADKTK
jgi:peptidyl-prolyl cis-trans isomerase C